MVYSKMVTPIVHMLYTVEYVALLTVFLACARAKLSWVLVVASGTASMLLHGILLHIPSLPSDRAQRRATRKTTYCIDKWLHVRNPRAGAWFGVPQWPPKVRRPLLVIEHCAMRVAGTEFS